MYPSPVVVPAVLHHPWFTSSYSSATSGSPSTTRGSTSSYSSATSGGPSTTRSAPQSHLSYLRLFRLPAAAVVAVAAAVSALPTITLSALPRISAQPLAFLYLSQIPYTGFDLGPIGTALY